MRYSARAAIRPGASASGSLVAAVVDLARFRGANGIEGYPLILEPGQQMSCGELYVGSPYVFADAGFVEVTRPTKRRGVMRIDFLILGRQAQISQRHKGNLLRDVSVIP
jgi:hypothetical protein